MSGSDGLPFGTVAEAFEQLEQTSSRKHLTTILADLLRRVDADAIAEVTYLLQGRVAPLYEPIEFGLGERSIDIAGAQLEMITDVGLLPGFYMSKIGKRFGRTVLFMNERR